MNGAPRFLIISVLSPFYICNSPNFSITKLVPPNSLNFKMTKLVLFNSPNFDVLKLVLRYFFGLKMLPFIFHENIRFVLTKALFFYNCCSFAPVEFSQSLTKPSNFGHLYELSRRLNLMQTNPNSQNSTKTDTIQSSLDSTKCIKFRRRDKYFADKRFHF